jgi:hypothetical protein
VSAPVLVMTIAPIITTQNERKREIKIGKGIREMGNGNLQKKPV